jgi:hypothetical protein
MRSLWRVRHNRPALDANFLLARPTSPTTRCHSYQRSPVRQERDPSVVSCPSGARPLSRSGTQKTAVRSTYAETQLRTILGPDIMTDDLGRLRDWFESSRADSSYLPLSRCQRAGRKGRPKTEGMQLSSKETLNE